MDSNSGLPPEIVVLCTTAETREKAADLLDCIRNIPDIRDELAWNPAIPAICSLIASEQLGSTVVTERRAHQWSQSTPEQFRTVMSEVQKLLSASTVHRQHRKGRLTLQALVAEFCSDQNALNHVMVVENAFIRADGKTRWHLESDLVQLSLFIWSCRQFKIRTFRPVEEIQHCHKIPAASFNQIHDFLDKYCLSTLSKTNASPLHATTLSAREENSRSPSSTGRATPLAPLDGTSSSGTSIKLEDLAHEFGVPEDVMEGMRYLDGMVRKSEDFKDLVNWSSTMGRCVVFYWTCSVLKIPGAKHITLRNRFQLAKKEFDKILSALDLHRTDLRKKLEVFYAGNPALQLLRHSTQWAATSPGIQSAPPAPDLVTEKSASPARKLSSKASEKRGRPPKPNSPPPIPLDPSSKQEHELSPLCGGPAALRRAILLLRSFNAKCRPGSEADRIPVECLPAMIALVASQQLGDAKMTEKQARQESRLITVDFPIALATVRLSIDVFDEVTRPFAAQTTFDDLLLEHGLGIDTAVCMMHVREALKASRCLSTGMDWDSPLVKCSVFFWTCAILKVPDVKQTLLRSRSLVSKREFDSMLQLLNSHCAGVRHRLEAETARGAFVLAPPPYASQRRQPSSVYEEVNLEAHNDKRLKRTQRETVTPSDMGSDTERSYSYVPSKKRGRPPGYRKPSQRGNGSDGSRPDPFKDPRAIYTSTTQFPPPDWNPPESLSRTIQAGSVSSSACPPSETGDSQRRHTRYSTKDYEDTLYDRLAVWKPGGEELARHQVQYRRWEEKMVLLYGPLWEKNISHEKPGIPFE